MELDERLEQIERRIGLLHEEIIETQRLLSGRSGRAQKRRVSDNEDLKEYIKNSGVKMWQVAEALGLEDSNFSRRLRYALTEDERAAIYEATKKIKSEMEVRT